MILFHYQLMFNRVFFDLESTRDLINFAKEYHREVFGCEPALFQQPRQESCLNMIAPNDDESDGDGDKLCEDENDDLSEMLLAFKCLLKMVRHELFELQRRQEHSLHMTMDLCSENVVLIQRILNVNSSA